MISFLEFAIRHPERFREALAEMHVERLAELMDRGDELQLGKIVRHVIDIAIHEDQCFEMPELKPIETKVVKLGPIEPVMLRRQCD